MARLSTMNFLVAVILCIFSFATAQTGPAGSPPQCGVNTVITALSSSGCGVSDAACTCTNTKLINTLKKELPQKCKKPEDQATYAKFFNTICASYSEHGFPINFTQSALETSDAGASAVKVASWAVPIMVMSALIL